MTASDLQKDISRGGKQMFIDMILVFAACAIVAGVFTALCVVFEWARFAAWVAYDEHQRDNGRKPKRG